MRSPSLFLIFAFTAAFAQPAATPPKPDQPESPIIVEGRVRDFLRSFVGSLTQTGPTDQVARWKDEICPTVTGIDPAEATFVEARMIEIARKIGLREGGPGCVTTLAVIVTPDAGGFANDLVSQYPITLRRDGGARLKSFANTTGPVRWISVTNECGEKCVLPNSRLAKSTKPMFSAMIIVVDARQIGGLTIGELSDYVSLVALSNPPLDGRRSPKSILAMFDHPRAPGASFALTCYDLSFLDGLYGSSSNQSAKVQRQSIMSHMRKDPQAQC